MSKKLTWPTDVEGVKPFERTADELEAEMLGIVEAGLTYEPEWVTLVLEAVGEALHVHAGIPKALRAWVSGLTPELLQHVRGEHDRVECLYRKRAILAGFRWGNLETGLPLRM